VVREFSERGRAFCISLGRANFPPSRSRVFLESVRPTLANSFRFQLAEKICKSVRADKVLGVGIEALVVSPSTGSSHWCRHAEHELATARLKLPVSQSGLKFSSDPYVPPTTHDGDSRIGKLAPEFKSLSTSHLAEADTKPSLPLADSVMLRGSAPRTPKSKSTAKREPGKKGVLCLMNFV
jgi:hypothetical protein